MKGRVTTLGVLLGLMLLACEASPSDSPTNSVISGFQTNQVVALSNEVVRLSKRVESLEREVVACRSDIEIILKMVDVRLYEPVVDAELIVAPTNGAPDEPQNKPLQDSDVPPQPER